jgi:WD40 repeat protein
MLLKQLEMITMKNSIISILSFLIAISAMAQPMPTGSDTLWVHPLTPRASVFSSFIDNDTRIISAVDNCFYILDKETGEFVDSLESNKETIYDACLSLDNSRVAALVGHGNLTVWDIQTKKIHRYFAKKEFQQNFGNISLSPDGRYLISASDSLLVFDLNTNSIVRWLKLSSPFRATAFSPDGKQLAVSIGDGWDPNNNIGIIQIFDTKTWQLVKQVDMSKGQSEYLSYSKDGKYLCATKILQTSTVWEATNYTLVKAYPVRSELGYPRRITFSPYNKFLIMACDVPHLWDFNGDTLYKRLDNLNEYYNGPEICIDHSYSYLLKPTNAWIGMYKPKWLATDVTNDNSTTEGFNVIFKNTKLIITSKDNNLISNISIYDIQGKTIIQDIEPAISHEIILPELSGNIIFIKAKVNGTFYTNKLMLPN